MTVIVVDTPWKNIGTDNLKQMSAKEMQKACGANFKVSKEPEFIMRKNQKIPTGNYSLVRDDNDFILDSVSAEWNIVQNDECFDFIEQFNKESKSKISTAGVLNEGRIVWALSKVNESFDLFKGKDQIDSYLLFTVPQMYGRSTTVMSTPVRVVCQNTLQLALSQKSEHMVKINHRKVFDKEFVRTTLGLNKNRLTSYKEAAEFLSSKKANKKQASEFFAKLFPLTSNKKKEEQLSRNAILLSEIVETQPGSEFGKGSWWQAFNAVTYATDHLIGNSDETRFNSAFYGSGRERKIEALKLATQYANAA